MTNPNRLPKIKNWDYNWQVFHWRIANGLVDIPMDWPSPDAHIGEIFQHFFTFIYGFCCILFCRPSTPPLSIYYSEALVFHLNSATVAKKPLVFHLNSLNSWSSHLVAMQILKNRNIIQSCQLQTYREKREKWLDFVIMQLTAYFICIK